MENCRASRISAAETGDAPASAHAPATRLKSALVRMWFLPAAAACFLFLWAAAHTLSGGPDLGNAAVPVEDLLAVPVQHAFVLVHVVVDLLEIFDPARLPADV